MATIEKSGTLKYKDAAGDVYVLNPKTTGDDRFVVNVTGWTFGTGSLVENAVPDKTYAETYAAYLAGKSVVMRVDGWELPITLGNQDSMTFSLADPDAPDTLDVWDVASVVWYQDSGSLECGDGTIYIPMVPKTANLLKGNGRGNISAATPGTDYVTPDGMNTAIEAAKEYADGKIAYSTSDLTTGESALTTGKLYVVYE